MAAFAAKLQQLEYIAENPSREGIPEGIPRACEKKRKV